MACMPTSQQKAGSLGYPPFPHAPTPQNHNTTRNSPLAQVLFNLGELRQGVEEIADQAAAAAGRELAAALDPRKLSSAAAGGARGGGAGAGGAPAKAHDALWDKLGAALELLQKRCAPGGSAPTVVMLRRAPAALAASSAGIALGAAQKPARCGCSLLSSSSIAQPSHPPTPPPPLPPHSAIQLWHLQRVLAKKRDPLSHTLFLDVVAPEEGDPLPLDRFWWAPARLIACPRVLAPTVYDQCMAARPSSLQTRFLLCTTCPPLKC